MIVDLENERSNYSIPLEVEDHQNLHNFMLEYLRSGNNQVSGCDDVAVRNGLYLLPGTPEVMSLNTELSTMLHCGLLNPGVYATARHTLRNFRQAITKLAMALGCTLVIIDLSSDTSAFTQVAVMSCDYVCPVFRPSSNMEWASRAFAGLFEKWRNTHAAYLDHTPFLTGLVVSDPTISFNMDQIKGASECLARYQRHPKKCQPSSVGKSIGSTIVAACIMEALSDIL